MPTSGATTGPGFWRCDHCGTPNPGTLYITACIGCGAPRPPRGTETRADAPTRRPGSRVGPRRRSLTTVVAAYGLVLIALCLLARGIGDAWWPGMALSLAPRAVFLLPLLPMAAWAWRARRPWIAGVVAIEALFVAGPLMGFVVPWGRIGAKAEGPRVRVMTFNRGLGTVDAPRLVDYLDRHRIDVVCFQEYHHDPALDRLLAARSWHRDLDGAIASRLPIEAELPRSAELNAKDPRYPGVLYTALLHRVRLRAPDGRAFVVGSLHMPTSRYALGRLLRLEPSSMTPFIAWWNAEFRRMSDLFAEAGDLPVLVGGDFNNGPDASALAALLDSGAYRSAFDEAGLGWGYTRPSEFPWARIDHILAGPEWAVTACWVGPSFGSDHRSLVAEVALPAKP